MTETTESPAANRLPAFYKTPVPLTPERHARAGLKTDVSYAFAGGVNAIMLAASELAIAARYYPIAFSSQSPAVPLAVLGFRDGENLFVDAAGRWRPDTYIPAYVQRYPFIFLSEPESKRLILCVDESATSFSSAAPANAFFTDGKPSPMLDQVLRFCDGYQQQFEETRRLGAWIEAESLLEDRVARAELADGTMMTLSGFRTIDANKFNALSDEKVLEAHRRGWLPALYFHLQSLGNWNLLSQLAAARTKSKG